MENKTAPVKRRKKRTKESVDYVNNQDFSRALGDYAKVIKEHEEQGLDSPRIPEYIGDCILRINRGMASRPNFSGYTFVEDMIMDGVENCLEKLGNYDYERPTRTGYPNGFSYFTQIGWYAFIRRIQKEKKQTDIKNKVIATADVSSFGTFGGNANELIGQSIVNKMKENNPYYKDIQEKFADENGSKASKPRSRKKAESTTATLF